MVISYICFSFKKNYAFIIQTSLDSDLSLKLQHVVAIVNGTMAIAVKIKRYILRSDLNNVWFWQQSQKSHSHHHSNRHHIAVSQKDLISIMFDFFNHILHCHHNNCCHHSNCHHIIVSKKDTLLRLDLSLKLQCGGDCCGYNYVTTIIVTKMQNVNEKVVNAVNITIQS